MAFDATPVTVDNGEGVDYTAAVRTTTVGKIVGCQLDIGTDATPSPVTPTNPMPIFNASPPAASLTAGNVISQGLILAADIETAAPAGLNLIDYTSSMILSVMIYNRLTVDVEISFDGGVTWVVLPAGASPTVEFFKDARKIATDIQVRKKSGVTVAGTDIMAWGKI